MKSVVENRPLPLYIGGTKGDRLPVAHRLRCAALSGGAPDDPLADGLIWVVAAVGVTGS